MSHPLVRLLARRVRAARRAAGYSQRDLQRRAHVAQKTVSNLERLDPGQSSPTLANAAAVADALRVPLWCLVWPDEPDAALELLRAFESLGHDDREHLLHLARALSVARHHAPLVRR